MWRLGGLWYTTRHGHPIDHSGYCRARRLRRVAYRRWSCHGKEGQERGRFLLWRQEGAVVDGGDQLLHGDDQFVCLHRLRADRLRRRTCRTGRLLVHGVRDTRRNIRLRPAVAAGEPRDASRIPRTSVWARRKAGCLLVRCRVPRPRQHGAPLHPRHHRLAVPRRLASGRHRPWGVGRPRLHARWRPLECRRHRHRAMRGADGGCGHGPAAVAERRRRHLRALREGAGTLLPFQRPPRHLVVSGGVLPDRVHQVQRQLVVRAAPRFRAERTRRGEDGPSLRGDFLRVPRLRRPARGRCAGVPAGPAAGAA